MNFWDLAKEVLVNLAKEYRVPVPSLRVGDPSEMGNDVGLYYDFTQEILIAKDILKDQVETVKTIRHEFAHYWQNFIGLPMRERCARHFEQPSTGLDLPHNQRTLLSWLASEEVASV